MNESLKNKIIKLKKKGLSYEEISNELGCSKGTISYHCNNEGLGSDSKISDDVIHLMNEYYKGHTMKETAEKFNVGTATVTKYCKNKKILLTNEERVVKNRERVKKRRRDLKIMAVEYKGGCCEKCSYDKCIDALDFHHLDPDKKDFGIANNGLIRSWEKIKKEIDKCILVCSNCHREIHAGLIKL